MWRGAGSCLSCWGDGGGCGREGYEQEGRDCICMLGTWQQCLWGGP